MTANTLKRHLLGVFALLLLITGSVLLLRGASDSTTKALAAGCLRMGAVLAAGWLAFKQVNAILSRVPGWMLGAMGVGLLTVIARPRTALYIVPGMIVLWFLGPRRPKSPPGESARREPSRAASRGG